MAETKLDRLLSNLQTSGLQQKDQPLFQVISQLIKYLKQAEVEIVALNEIVIPTSSPSLESLTYLTDTNESGSLPNSRRLLAGANISFDDSIINQRTINASALVGSEWSVLTNGDLLYPELIFAGGDVVMLHVP